MGTVEKKTQHEVSREPFVDAREAAFVMNLPLYYLTNAGQRAKLHLPHYHIGRLVRFRLSELSIWQSKQGAGAVNPDRRTGGDDE